MPYGNLNVDTVTTSTAGGVLGAGNASIMKNRLINGSFVIDQRNAGASVTPTASVYTLDRWYWGLPVASKIAIQQSTTVPTGFINSAVSTVASAYTPSSGEVFRFLQKIEGFNCSDLGFGTASATTITLSFWVRNSVTGTYAVSLQNSANSRSYVASYTVTATNTWEQKTITVAGDTSGTWLTNNGSGIQVAFCLQSGSNFQTTTGSWQTGEYYSTSGASTWLQTAGATFYITGVQLEVGSSATGYEYRQYGQELALCQRYYQVFNSGTGAAYPSAAGAVAISGVNFIQTMRAAPTVTLGTVTASLNASSDDFTIQSPTSVGCVYRVTQGGSAGNYYQSRNNNTASSEL